MNVSVYTVRSFAKTEEGGNEAGVVLNADNLSEEEMRKIAALIGFSETAFVMNSKVADFKVRFFTPQDEVDLCGHATIAVFYTMAVTGLLKTGAYKQETKAGILGIEVKENQFIMMNQTIPVFSDLPDRYEIADSLNIQESQLSQDLPVQIVSTGIRDIIIPVTGIQQLFAIQPDMEKIRQISRKYNVIGYHVFTLETQYGATAACRNFAPLYDILEEAATGTSNGALGCYLYHYGKVDSGQANNLVFEQGYSMKKPSEILVSLLVEGEEILGVRVGGSARNLRIRKVEL